jgi:putative sterol carrier protein
MREVIAKSAIDGVAFPKRESAEEDAAAAGTAVAPVPAATAGSGEPAEPFAAPELTPDLFEADVAETLDSVFSEGPAGPDGAQASAAAEAVPELPAPEPALYSWDATEPSFFAPAAAAAPPPGESTKPSFVPPPAEPAPAALEATEPAFFPPPAAAPLPVPHVPAEPVTLPGGPPSIAFGIPVPRNVAELFETLPLRFRAERAAGWNARFHFRFKDAARPDWTVVIEDGFCRTLEGHDGTADCVVTTTEKTYLAIESGQQSPETAFLLGKVKVSNVAAMTRFGKLFRKVAA